MPDAMLLNSYILNRRSSLFVSHDTMWQCFNLPNARKNPERDREDVSPNASADKHPAPNKVSTISYSGVTTSTCRSRDNSLTALTILCPITITLHANGRRQPVSLVVV